MLGRQAGLQVIAVQAEQQHALFSQNRLYAAEVAAFLKSSLKSVNKLAER